MRRIGNNYSGPRWLFSADEKPKKVSPKPRGQGGMSVMGGSNMTAEVHYDDPEDDPTFSATRCAVCGGLNPGDPSHARCM